MSNIADYASLTPWSGIQNPALPSTNAVGVVPILPGSDTQYLDGTGNWSVPGGGGGGLLKSAIYPTYPNPGGSEITIPILDLAGQKFSDINGNLQTAIGRIAIMATNYANSTDYQLQKSGSIVNNGPSALGVLARTSVYVPTFGDFSVSNGGGVNNLVISEIYNVS